MLFMQNVDIDELEKIKEKLNNEYIDEGMKDSICDVNISNNTLYYISK